MSSKIQKSVDNFGTELRMDLKCILETRHVIMKEEENKNIFLDILEMERRCIFVMTDGYVMQLVFASASILSKFIF